ncbi:unnamed protein product [Peniophora sp. CBMAI 1063]|nr:unnamed protein product [Peniophora sp. CBMAI 1063]
MEDAQPTRFSTPPPDSTVPNGNTSTEPLEDVSDGPAERLRVGYVYEEQMTLHRQDPVTVQSHGTHPEAPERITRVHEIFKNNSLLKHMKRLPIRAVTEREVLLAHAREVWEEVQSLATFTVEDISNSAFYYETKSLYVCPTTPIAARLSCGGVIEVCLAVARGEIEKAFANVRPPGHHAEPDKCMGFCFFNNVGVAVRAVQQQTNIKRIMILDWDVHHGNGTQKIFEKDADVLYVSLHVYENGTFYPCGVYGAMDSCGTGPGRGRSVNIPWPSTGRTDADYLLAMQSLVMPIAEEFAPELVIISSGFDAADGDELGRCKVSPGGYAHMTHMLSRLAGGRVVVALEGGYNVNSVARSALAVGRTLLGESPPEMEPLTASEEASETIFAVAKFQSQFWKKIDMRAVEPLDDEDRQVTWSIPDLVQAHRTDYMYRQLGMVQLPITKTFEQYSSQVMCTKDLWSAEVIVLFAHEMGNMRAELASKMTCDIEMESSYLIDASKGIVDWCKSEGYGLVDLNLHIKRPLITKADKESTRGIMTYIWDNYLCLTNARNIILVGHNQGVHAVMELINSRAATVTRQVSLVAQFVGYSSLPLVTKGEEQLRAWYSSHSVVFIPHDHPVKKDGKHLKRLGGLVTSNETKPIKLLIESLGSLKREAKSRVKQ